MNWLQNIQFEIQIARLPNFIYRASKVTIPQIDLQGPKKPTPFNHIPFTPDSISYGPLSVTSGMDENLEIWEEMYTWAQMGFPEDHKQYGDSQVEKVHHSDISVIMLNSKKNPFATFLFKNCIPINMGPLNLDTTQTSATVTEFTVDFEYDAMSLIRHK